MASIQNIKDFCDYQNCALAEYGRLYRTTAMKACIQPLYDSQYELLPFNGTPLHPNANSKKDNNNNNQKPTNQRNSNNRLANTELYKNLKEAGPVRDPGMEDSSHYSHLHPSTTTTSLPDHIKHSIMTKVLLNLATLLPRFTGIATDSTITHKPRSKAHTTLNN
eukprot:GHVP01003160.1.p1 GENE.GHVP01003160.1~~GHVP01003160.1.p1  ORF type:complete len:164 (-),score=4.60 GHVP01003160.1:668-1159(-)